MNNSEKAVSTFKDGYNCAQSVLWGLSAYTGLTDDHSFRIATGFGGGMGRAQHVCGAVTGGILALNHLYGRGKDEGKEKQEVVYQKVRDFIAQFEKLNQTVICRELLDGCNLLTEEGQERFGSENMALNCQRYIASAVEIIERIIAAEQAE